MNFCEQLPSLTHEEKVFFFESISDEDFFKFCQVNKELYSLCYDSMETERFFKTRAEKFIPELIQFKERENRVPMKWKEFYIRIYKFQKEKNKDVIEYCKEGKLMELKICASLNPPILPTQIGANFAAIKNCLNVLQWLASLNPSILPTQDGADCAAINDHLNVLEWLASRNPPVLGTHDGADCAAINGHLNVLEWLASQNPPVLPTQKGANNAAYGGHLNVLQWMASRNLPILPTEEGVNWAAKDGHLNVLRWMASRNPPILPTN